MIDLEIKLLLQEFINKQRIDLEKLRINFQSRLKLGKKSFFFFLTGVENEWMEL